MRTWIGGAALVTTVSLGGAIVTPRGAAADDPPPAEVTFSNPGGVLATLTTSGAFGGRNPFFADLGANGRSCSTCHQPAQAWTITPVDHRRGARRRRDSTDRDGTGLVDHASTRG